MTDRMYPRVRLHLFQNSRELGALSKPALLPPCGDSRCCLPWLCAAKVVVGLSVDSEKEVAQISNERYAVHDATPPMLEETVGREVQRLQTVSDLSQFRALA